MEKIMIKINNLIVAIMVFAITNLFSMEMKDKSQEKMEIEESSKPSWVEKFCQERISNKTEIFDKEDANKKQTMVAVLKTKISPILSPEIAMHILFEVISDSNTKNTPDEKLYIALEFLSDPDYSKIHNQLIDFIYSQCDLSMKAKKSPYEKLADIYFMKNNKNSLENSAKCYRKDRTNSELKKLAKIALLIKMTKTKKHN